MTDKKIVTMELLRFIAKKGLAVFLAFFFLQGSAQKIQAINSHSFSIGASSVSVTDNYADLAFKGIRSTELAYNYSSVSGWRKKNILLSWTNGQVPALKFDDFRLTYTDAFSVIKNKNNRFNNYVGYLVSTNPVFMSTGNALKQHSWAMSTALSVYSSSTYCWNRNSLSLDLSIPVAGFASLPATGSSYGDNMNELLYNSYSDVFFTSLHNLTAASIDLQYSRALSKRINIFAGYRYQYKKLDRENLFLQVSHGVKVGFSFSMH